MKTYFTGPANGSYQISPIGFIESPFKHRYGVPRQPKLADQMHGTIYLNNDPDLRTAVKQLEGYSHLWIIFVFHSHGGKNWKPSIRPPKLGGRKKVGVLASRSPHRPNPIGLSVVKIENISIDKNGQIKIRISGVDLLNETPVLDIKPYLPYTDSIANATTGWSSGEFKKYPVIFSSKSCSFLETLSNSEEIKNSIVQVLEIDPRPGYQQRKTPASSKEAENLKLGIAILDFEIKYRFEQSSITVLEICKK